MAYLGEIPIAEVAPNHPWAQPQISFGVKRPQGLKQPLQEPQQPVQGAQQPDEPAKGDGVDDKA